jgi:hypothetical protein
MFNAIIYTILNGLSFNVVLPLLAPILVILAEFGVIK